MDWLQLISTSQLMHNEVVVDMVPLVYPHQNAPGNGTQGMTVVGIDIPLSYDGIQLPVQHCAPTAHELVTLVPIILTSSDQWWPWRDLLKRARHRMVDAPSECAIVVCHPSVSKEAIEKWQQNLGFAPQKAIFETLANTTQLAISVTSNHQDVPQHHLVSCLLQL
jgi:hypothetical protein